MPFPRAADDHQRRNAEALERAGAAILLPESELTAQKLVDSVVSVLSDPARRAEMSNAALSLSHPDAARQIAELAGRLAGWPAAARA